MRNQLDPTLVAGTVARMGKATAPEGKAVDVMDTSPIYTKLVEELLRRSDGMPEYSEAASESSAASSDDVDSTTAASIPVAFACNDDGLAPG